jgi:chromosome segregation ATPase
MNETRKPDKLDNFTGKAGEEHSHFTPPALDSAFPSVKLMLVLIGLVIVLITISGWKVFNIEKEKAYLETERRLLERDKNASAALRRQLPELEDRQQELKREIAELEGKLRSLETRYENIKIQIGNAESGLDKIKAERKQAETAVQVAREELAGLNSKIKRARSESSRLKKDVTSLRALEKDLTDKKQGLLNEIATYEADIQRLKRSKENNKKLLEEIVAENGQLTALGKKMES